MIGQSRILEPCVSRLSNVTRPALRRMDPPRRLSSMVSRPRLNTAANLPQIVGACCAMRGANAARECRKRYDAEQRDGAQRRHQFPSRKSRTILFSVAHKELSQEFNVYRR